MADSNPVDILCRCRVKPGKESEFTQSSTAHWKVLHDAGLSTDEPARLQRATDRSGNVAFIEQFAWKDADSSGVAHQTEAVMKLWEPMGALCEDMEFWEVGPLEG